MLAVVVAYGRRLDEVLAWPFLRNNLVADVAGPAGEAGFVVERVLVYDNSPTPLARPGESLPGLSYVHDAQNGGTAAAYAYASQAAAVAGVEWLLLLDHDTSLPSGFIAAASGVYASHRPHAPRALLPWVFHGEAIVSPARVTKSGTIEPLAYRTPPSPKSGLTGIASGSLLHAPTLGALMPFPPALWLDYVDHWIFLQLNARSLPVAVFDALLHHDLSVSDIRSLGVRRLTSVLDGEASFIALLGPTAKLVYPFRLLARVLRYALARPDLARHIVAWAGRRLVARP